MNLASFDLFGYFSFARICFNISGLFIDHVFRNFTRTGLFWPLLIKTTSDMLCMTYVRLADLGSSPLGDWTSWRFRKSVDHTGRKVFTSDINNNHAMILFWNELDKVPVIEDMDMGYIS